MCLEKAGDWIDEAGRYVRDNAKYVYVVVLVFVAAGLFGFIAVEHLGFFDEVLRKIIEKTEGLSGFELILFILKNNVFAAFTGLILGFALGVVPVINALTNGVLIGYVLARAYEVSGFLDFWRLLPHGVFELPAIWIALGMGMKLGGFVFAGKGKLWKEFRTRLRKCLLVFVFIVVPLLVIAAVIEGLLIAMGA